MPHTIDGIGLGVKSVGDYTFNNAFGIPISYLLQM